MDSGFGNDMEFNLQRSQETQIKRHPGKLRNITYKDATFQITNAKCFSHPPILQNALGNEGWV